MDDDRGYKVMNDKYCVLGKDRVHGMYHEFFKGRWNGEPPWKEDSLLIGDNELHEVDGFVQALSDAVPEYDMYGETEVSAEQWRQVGVFIRNKDKESRTVYGEIDTWAQEVFREHDCFTILGL